MPIEDFLICRNSGPGFSKRDSYPDAYSTLPNTKSSGNVMNFARAKHIPLESTASSPTMIYTTSCPTHIEPMEIWRSLVRRYTERSLTVSSDKLHALSGSRKLDHAWRAKCDRIINIYLSLS